MFALVSHPCLIQHRNVETPGHTDHAAAFLTRMRREEVLPPQSFARHRHLVRKLQPRERDASSCVLRGAGPRGRILGLKVWM